MRQAALAPCRLMRGLLDLLVDGHLRGPFRWMTELHLRHCRKCTHAHRALLALREQMLASRGGDVELLSDERWREIEATCRER
ncbi:MAG: hypothetical protein AB7F50_03235 [Fimbriimonadaceae bacterium]